MSLFPGEEISHGLESRPTGGPGNSGNQQVKGGAGVGGRGRVGVRVRGRGGKGRGRWEGEGSVVLRGRERGKGNSSGGGVRIVLWSLAFHRESRIIWVDQ